MTTLENNALHQPSAEAIVKQYASQTALFLEFGNALGVFATVEDQGKLYYKHLRAVQALAYIINYVQIHFPDAAHNVITSLCTQAHAQTPEGIYRLFLVVYEKDLQDPKHQQGTAYEAILCENELTRMMREKTNASPLKLGPHHFFRPAWFTEMTETLGHREDPLFVKPFDTLLLQAQQKLAHTDTTKHNLIENFNASPDSA